jgi:hypothetical protein
MVRYSYPHATMTACLCLAACLHAACGVSDRKVNENAGGNASVAGSSGANAGSDQGGSGDSGGMPNSSGSGGEAGEAGAAGAGNPGCTNDALRCADNSTPSKCIAGAWIDQDPCPASKPACSNGVCAVATLSGGIVTVSDGVLSTSTVHLVEHGLEYTQTTCGTVGTKKVCVTGGIRP